MHCKRCGENDARICISCTGDLQDAERDAQAARIKALEAVLYEAEAALKPYTGQDIRPGKAYTLSLAAVQGMRAALRNPSAKEE